MIPAGPWYEIKVEWDAGVRGRLLGREAHSGQRADMIRVIVGSWALRMCIR